MSIRDDRINSGDDVGGCLMLVSLCVLACLPVIAAMILMAMMS